MKGFIYIASAFHTVNRSQCGRGGAWVDNDPHFWTQPPTWGICRNDLRKKSNCGDYIFFVLPRHGRHPQMIFAYLCIQKKISHIDAHGRLDLLNKRMANTNPNGNIIVDADGNYNRFDAGVHKHKFDRIKTDYVVGDPAKSRMLDDRAIRSLAPTFLPTLTAVLGFTGSRAVDIITRAGRQLNEEQINGLLAWLGTV